MTKNRIARLALVVVPLAAGLGIAAYLTAGDADKLRPRDVPVRIAFAAPAVTSQQPAPAYYQAQVRDLTHGTSDLVTPLSFSTVHGPVDSHIVWVPLDYYYTYDVQVRGVGAGGALGAWSVWSDPREISSPWETPEPPTD